MFRRVQGMAVPGNHKMERNTPDTASNFFAIRECRGHSSIGPAATERVDGMMEQQKANRGVFTRGVAYGQELSERVLGVSQGQAPPIGMRSELAPCQDARERSSWHGARAI
jgi:hypothetical protein